MAASGAMIGAAMATPEQRKACVLVVDDEPTIGDVVARYLQRAGFDAHVATDGAQALALSAELEPDLIVLDIMLPSLDGLAVMRAMRARAGRAPAVILLSAKGEESDRIVGLREGADDYMVKPFSPTELIARVDAVLRRCNQSPDVDAGEAPLCFGDLRIDVAARTAHSGERELALTQREFDLLAFMARHPGRVFSRDQLMELVWDAPFYTDTSTVTVHIRRLRAKIEPQSERPRHIQTVWGVGYRFCR
jgi:DNA-binding response OmpR family regulator